jgi:hypothetical protein
MRPQKVDELIHGHLWGPRNFRYIPRQHCALQDLVSYDWLSYQHI